MLPSLFLRRGICHGPSSFIFKISFTIIRTPFIPRVSNQVNRWYVGNPAHTISPIQSSARAESLSSKQLPPDVYKPLDKTTGEIRLIEILPSEESNAAVEVRLFRRRLEDVSGQFIPLSYVWGDAANTTVIKVNGIPKRVTRNLAELLQQTRSLLPEILAKSSWNKPALFWADAICINQQDLEERNHQVQLLKSIYSSAPLVLAWIGHGRDAHLAARLAESLTSLEESASALGLQRFDYRSWDYSLWMQEHPHLWDFSECGNAYWDAFADLIQSPYWSRTWTFQEMALPTDIFFMYGASLIEWRSVMAVMHLLGAVNSMYMGDMRSPLPATEAHQVLYSVLQQFFILFAFSSLQVDRTRRRLASQILANRPNLTLVPQLAHNQATDPRDKVYGLLGIMETSLEADYTKDMTQVYAEFVSAWIQEVGNINFLCFSSQDCHVTRNSPNTLPSWAPDWDAVSQSRYNLRHVPPSFRNASASAHLSTSHAYLCDGLRALTVAGVVVARVDEVYPGGCLDASAVEFITPLMQLAKRYTTLFSVQPGPRDWPPGPGMHVFQLLFRAATLNLSLCPVLTDATGKQEQQQSVALCFLAGMLYEVAGAHDSTHPDWQGVAATYLPQLGIPAGREFSKAWREDVFRGYSPEGNMVDWEGGAAAMEQTWKNCQQHVEDMGTHTTAFLGVLVKFITNNGYIGTATAAQAGDLVVVLAGCDAPVLLRRKGSHYEHVAPCFVIGLMDGEAKKMVHRGEAEIETFEIR